MAKIHKSRSKNSIRINLLPQEIVLAQDYIAKQNFVKNLTIAIILIFITISLSTTLFKLAVNTNVSSIKERFESLQTKIAEFKNREGLLKSLKERLAQIDALIKQPPSSAKAFALITALTPPGVRPVQININSKNRTSYGGETSSEVALRAFLDNLTTLNLNNGQIEQARLESLTQGSDGKIRFEITITLKQ